MGLDKNVEYRLRWLDNKFRTGAFFTKDELLSAFKAETANMSISRRTLEYDLERLGSRVEIKEQHSREGKLFGYEDKRKSYFEAGDGNNILLVEKFVQMMSQIDGIDLFDEFKNSLKKLSEQFNIDLSGDSFISFETNGNLRGLRDLDFYYNAIKNKQVLCVKIESYNRNMDAKYKPMTIHPYHLKEYANRWYLIGFTDEYKEKTCLPIDRIRSRVVVKNVEYIKNDWNIDYSGIFDDRLGVSNGKLIELQIRVHPIRYRYLESKPLHLSQSVVDHDENGWVRLKYSIVDNEELRQKLLSYGHEVEVVKPIGLRKVIIKRLMGSLNLYEQKKICL